jgi:hypothetical protein
MVSLASMFVLGEYWSCERGEHSSGKLRVRGVQIRSVLSKVSNCCDVFVVNVPLSSGKLKKRTQTWG